MELVQKQRAALQPAGHALWETPKALKNRHFYEGLRVFATQGESKSALRALRV